MREEKGFAKGSNWLEPIAKYFIGVCEASYYVNLTTKSITVLKDDGLKKRKLSEDNALNFTEALPFYIENFVHPDDKQDVIGELNISYIREQFTNADSFSFSFRELYESVESVYQCIVLKGDDEEHVIVNFLDITKEFTASEEMALKQKNEKLQNELINQMLGAEGLFLIDCVKNTRKTIHDHCFGAGHYSDAERYSECVLRYVNTCVLEHDRAMMRDAVNPSKMLERLSNEKDYSVVYSDITSGLPKFYQMRVVRFSDTEVLQSFIEKDQEYLDNLFFKKMKEEYFALFVINLDTETIKIVKNESQYTTGKVGESAPYTKVIKEYAKILEKEPQDFFMQMSSIDYVRKELAKEDKHTFSYKSGIPGGKTWVDVTSYVILRHDDGTPALFSLGFSFTDSLGANRQELQSRLTEDMQMIGGLASGYHALYYFNIDESIFKIYSLDGKRVPELKEYVSEDGDPREMIKRFGLSNLVHPEDRHVLEEITVESVRERLAHSKKFSVRFRRNVDGEYLWTELDVIKYEDVDEQANALALGFAIRDEEIRKEQEQQKMLEDARNAAEAASKAKTNFLFSMSHDIRTPMNAITGFTAMAKKYADDKEKVKGYLEKIDISGQQLLILINQVLEMARIESGKAELDEKPINLSRKFKSMVTVLSGQASAKEMDFSYSLKSIKHPDVFADEARLSSIIMNIGGNAMKYTPEGGKVDVTLKEIGSSKQGYATYVLTVSDTGIGMSEKFLSKLYVPFSRENNSTVSKIQGTGLGLSIVKNLVDLMGGKIEVWSEPGKGTRFDITLDLRIDEEANDREAHEFNLKEISFKGRRMLLVEDNEMNREIAKNIFSEVGFTVDEADDGDVAVNIIRKALKSRKPFKYDIILMDVQMPRMSGYEATKLIREMLAGKECENIPIIAMTANAFEEDRTDAIAAGMSEHLAKPIDIQKCFETLSRFLD